MLFFSQKRSNQTRDPDSTLEFTREMFFGRLNVK